MPVGPGPGASVQASFTGLEAKEMALPWLGNSHLAILYSTSSPQWATRIWWMLRAFGFDNARVLDGGLINWNQRGYPTSTHPAQYDPEVFTPRPRAGLIVGTEEIRLGIDDSNTCIVNALSRDQHTAKGGRTYGRPGRIANSVNVPTAELIDPRTNRFLPPDEIAQKFNSAGLNSADRVLTYCGGGIAASTTAMLLTMLGHENVGLYDNSLSEWALDKDLPMEIG